MRLVAVAAGTALAVFVTATPARATFPLPHPAPGDAAAELRRLVHAMDASGTEAPGWPKFTGGWIIATPAVGRLGTRPAVAVTTREGTLWVWRVRSDRAASFWPQARHDAANSGVLPR
jgi:hypothetical protein